MTIFPLKLYVNIYIMLKLFVSFGFFICVLIFSPSVGASSGNLVISEVQMGGSGAGTTAEEYISVYNNSTTPIDITNICLQYSTYNKVDFSPPTTIACALPSDIYTKLFLPAKSSLVAASNEFVNKQPVGYYADLVFTGGILSGSSTGGHIRVVDSNGQEIDKVGYGSAVNPETAPALFTPNNVDNRSIQRVGTTTKQDTNNNAIDFTQFPIAVYQQGSVYKEVIEVDVCPNIEGIQTTMPAGYLADSNGNCQKDVCANLDNLQVVIPDGYESLDGINCTAIPPENATLLITELLPNSASYDTGNEFIEIYNPNDRAISLKGYNLQLGPSFSKNYPLPADQTIAAKSYKAFSDIQTGLVLPNSSGFVRLIAPDGNTVSTTDIYSEPGEDMAWVLLNDAWQYTNQPTPSVANLPSLAGGSGGDSEGTITDLTSCPAGKYRNPETNRCKSVKSDDGLKPCAVDQVRNLETNRCRSIFSTTSLNLTPCSAGQERNPETNRCRKIGSTTASSLKPCAANQERNPATNRCRNKSASSAAAKAVRDIESQTVADRGGWFLAGSASLGLAGYGVAEWRSEIATGLRRFSALLGKNPPSA